MSSKEKTMPENQTLLVTGASGHLGRRVLELLLENQTGQIIATTRTPEKLADFAARGVVVRKADFEDTASLVEAFKGANRLLLISTDVIDAEGRRLRQHTNAVKAAEQAGVSHVVYTSLINPEPGTPVAIAPDHYGTEQALTQSKLGFTSLRNNIYMEMLPSTLQRALASGVLASATGDGKAAYVTREDCARAAAAALASTFDERRTLDITGPEAHSYSELAAIASEITGRAVNFVPLTLEVLIGHMVAAGLPRPMAEAYASFDAGIAQGKMNVVSSAVEDLTGRKPTSVREFLISQREALVPVG
jgi:NAD(P)H dehydrogenase (quinone)